MVDMVSSSGAGRVALPGTAVDYRRARWSRSTDEFVVEKTRGGPYTLQDFRRRIFVLAAKASVGLPVRPHDLRHTHVALLIAAGVHPKAIQERLGHRGIRMTLNTYGHLMDGLDQEAAERLDALVVLSDRANLPAEHTK